MGYAKHHSLSYRADTSNRGPCSVSDMANIQLGGSRRLGCTAPTGFGFGRAVLFRLALTSCRVRCSPGREDRHGADFLWIVFLGSLDLSGVVGEAASGWGCNGSGGYQDV